MSQFSETVKKEEDEERDVSQKKGKIIHCHCPQSGASEALPTYSFFIVAIHHLPNFSLSIQTYQ